MKNYERIGANYLGGVYLVLSPLDIHNKEFTRGMRGFREDEVNEFLDQVIKDYEITIRAKKDFESEVEELTEKVAHFTKIEDTLNKSIVIAQETAEELKANARKEDKLIIKEEEKNANRLINDACGQKSNILIEKNELKLHKK